jgi:DNA-binding NarL/FixJ family response regulator
VLADPVPLFREGVARLLADAGMDVVAQVSDVEGLLSAAARVRPDVVVVDPRLSGPASDDGLHAARWIRRSVPGVAVLVLGCAGDPSGAVARLGPGRGGVGHLAKDRIGTPAELVRAVECVAMGGSVLDRGRGSAQAGASATDGGGPLQRLSAREREVLALIAEGASNAAIADLLSIAGKTVDSHVGRILVKLGLGEDVGVNRRVRAALVYLEATRSGAPAA